jgi:hypothetical protein
MRSATKVFVGDGSAKFLQKCGFCVRQTHPPTVQPCDRDVTHDGKARPGSAPGTPVIVRTRVPALYVAAR